MPTFTTPEPITATLSTAGAQVRVVASDRSDTVVLVEPVTSASRSDAKVVENTTVEFSAGELTVRTNKAGSKNGSVAITIELPTRSALALNLAWSDVHTEGLLGDCELEVASGRVQLESIAALKAQFAAGELAVEHVAGPADIQASSGTVRIGEVEGVLTYEGATGEIWIGTARSDVELGNASGRLDVERAEGSVTAKGADCPIRIGRTTRGRLDLANHSGGIEIGIGEGTVAWVDAMSTKGQVRNALSTRDDPDGFDDKVSVHARARHDDIVIRRAVG